jgi:hypothetical protein
MADKAAMDAKIQTMKDSVDGVVAFWQTELSDANAMINRLLAIIAGGTVPVDYQPEIDTITAANQKISDMLASMQSLDATFKSEGN